MWPCIFAPGSIVLYIGPHTATISTSQCAHHHQGHSSRTDLQRCQRTWSRSSTWHPPERPGALQLPPACLQCQQPCSPQLQHPHAPSHRMLAVLACIHPSQVRPCRVLKISGSQSCHAAAWMKPILILRKLHHLDLLHPMSKPPRRYRSNDIMEARHQ